MTETRRLQGDSAGVQAAADVLRQGALVAFPTETVYGLGADARNGAAVAAIYAAKDRPRFNPLIVHVKDLQTARLFADFGTQALHLAAAFWPGPLSLVLPLRPDHGLSDLVTAGLDTVALRVPAHPGAQALLGAFDGPIAAPSANLSGRISPTTATHVADGLSGRIAAILDHGDSTVGLESTIIGLHDSPVLLRPGGIAAEDIEAVLGAKLMQPQDGKITSPGQMASHYAPRARLRMNAASAGPDELMLGFGAMPCDLNLSERADLQEAATRLFAHLHALDKQGKPIAVAPIPNHGLGAAINDRLARAAAPRG